jgi:hypothetical protein
MINGILSAQADGAGELLSSGAVCECMLASCLDWPLLHGAALSSPVQVLRNVAPARGLRNSGWLGMILSLAKQSMQMQSEAGKKKVDEMLQTLHTLPSSLTDKTLCQQAVQDL